MAIKFERVKAGDRLYDYHSTFAGNTKVREWCNWDVEIMSIDHERGVATVRWNGNAPREWSRRRVEKLRRTPGKERGIR